MQVTALVAGFTDSRSSAAWKGKKDRPGCSSRAARSEAIASSFGAHIQIAWVFPTIAKSQHLQYIYIYWANYNDLTATSLESWIIRGIIPKWPYFRLVNYCNLPSIYIDMSYTLVSHNLTTIIDIYRPSYIAFHFTPPRSISVWSDGKLPSCIRISPKIWVNLRHLGVHSFYEMESPCLVWRRYFEHITLEILERCLGEFEELLHFKCLPSKKENDGPLWLSSVQQGKTPNEAFVGTFWKWWRVGSEQLMGYLLVDTGSTWLHAINIYQSVLRQYFPYDAGHGSSLCFKCHQYASGISTHHQPRHEVPQDDDIHCGAVRGNRGKPGCAKDV